MHFLEPESEIELQGRCFQTPGTFLKLGHPIGIFLSGKRRFFVFGLSPVAFQTHRKGIPRHRGADVEEPCKIHMRLLLEEHRRKRRCEACIDCDFKTPMAEAVIRAFPADSAEACLLPSTEATSGKSFVHETASAPCATSCIRS